MTSPTSEQPMIQSLNAQTRLYTFAFTLLKRTMKPLALGFVLILVLQGGVLVLQRHYEQLIVKQERVLSQFLTVLQAEVSNKLQADVIQGTYERFKAYERVMRLRHQQYATILGQLICGLIILLVKNYLAAGMNQYLTTAHIDGVKARARMWQMLLAYFLLWPLLIIAFAGIIVFGLITAKVLSVPHMVAGAIGLLFVVVCAFYLFLIPGVLAHEGVINPNKVLARIVEIAHNNAWVWFKTTLLYMWPVIVLNVIIFTALYFSLALVTVSLLYIVLYIGRHLVAFGLCFSLISWYYIPASLVTYHRTCAGQNKAPKLDKP